MLRSAFRYDAVFERDSADIADQRRLEPRTKQIGSCKSHVGICAVISIVRPKKIGKNIKPKAIELNKHQVMNTKAIMRKSQYFGASRGATANSRTDGVSSPHAHRVCNGGKEVTNLQQ